MRKTIAKFSTLYFNYILIIGILTLVIFTIARVSLILLINSQGIEVDSHTFRQILSNGLPFDIFIISFYSAPSLLIFLSLLWVTNEKTQKILFKINVWYYVISLPIILVLTVADIPYFLFFKNKLTESAFQWMDNPLIVLEMLLGNILHIVLLLIAIVVCVVIVWLLLRKGNQILCNCRDFTLYKSKTFRILVTFVLLTLTFIGMRGRMDHPLKEGDAFFSDNATLNQLALNPIFTLVKSYEAKANLMDEKEAIILTKSFLNISSVIDSISPIAHYVEYNKSENKPNVILVIMESMSAAYMHFGGNTLGLTPNLDSLSRIGIMHTNMYSAGIHTNNGVFSTLYGFPAIKRTRPMGTVPLRRYSGIPFTLKQNGYATLFFTTHDKSFDNLGSFLPFNSFDKVFSQADYDNSALIGPFGVPDDYLFRFATKELSSEKAPFFATILTSSNHDPYIIPEAFMGKYKDKSLDAVHYADWAIGQFMEECRKAPWFENTIFLFIADHGLNIGQSISGFSLNYQHIPFIVYQPFRTIHKEVGTFMQQIDVFPYLMSLLQISYINNTLGAVPEQVQREMIYFSSDDKLTALNDEWLYIYYYSGSEYLYKKSEPESKNYIQDYPEIAAKFKQYAFSQTQTADWLFRHNKTKVE
ncbi:MAG: sulfatase-like hydrolase/transferase [Bacteroidetes bacterium]|nr:sulfatase-like hydrolase/transferase [Bacteroidota bacterium]